MASFDPKAFGIDSKADTGLFLFVGGLAGVADAVFDFARRELVLLSVLCSGSLQSGPGK